MIEITFCDEIAIVEMAHGKVNAFDIELCETMTRRLSEIAESACPAVVLTSRTGVFSAGIDLKRFLAEGSEYVRPYMAALEGLMESVFCFPKPLVADINGAAIAGGCMIATACDYRVIHGAAKIGILESRLGVPLPMMAIEILRHVADPQVFRSVITVGATYAGEEAIEAGLADQLADDSREAAILAAQQLAAVAAPAFQLTKRQRTEPVMRIVKENRCQLFEPYMQVWESDETRQAIRNYVLERLK